MGVDTELAEAGHSRRAGAVTAIEDAHGSAIFGRENELATVSAFTSAASNGWGALVLEGEPGIGKTTLWHAALEQAGQRGVEVLACSPASGERQLSFAALADLLADRIADASDWLPAPQRRALEVALLLADPAGQTVDQRTIGAATLGTLRELARTRPLLLAIDDIQWLDDPSALALAFALRRLGPAVVSVLATRRVDRRDLKQTVLEAALEQRHGERLVRLPIGPLTVGALHTAIQDRLGVAFPHWVLEQLHATSGGNPFYALELANALLRQQGVPEPGRALPVPATLQDLVSERLSALPHAVQKLLAVVAALSDPTAEVVEAAGVGGAIDEAVKSGVLGVSEGGRLRFSHPMLASGAYGRLGPRARRELHRGLAELVSGEERARHLALSARGPSAEISAVVHEAARAAAGRGAIGPAAALAEQAITLTPPDQHLDLSRRRLDASAYEMRSGETARARIHLEPLLVGTVPGPIRAAALLRLARLGEESPVRSLELCRQAVAEAGNDPLGAEANQLAAEMAMLSGDIHFAIEHARTAADLAERAGETALLIESLGTLSHYETYAGSITTGLLERAVEIERTNPRPSNNYSPREILGLRLMYSDHLDEARSLLEDSLDRTTEIGDELDRLALLIHLTQLECRAGLLSRAREHATEAVAISEQTARWTHAAPLFALSLADSHLGRATEAREAGEKGLAIARSGGSEVFRVLNQWALGFLALSLGRATDADRYLQSLPDELEAMGYRNPGVRPVYADAIEARIASGHLDVGSRIDELERRGRTLDNPWARATAARCRGLLLAAQGTVEEAIGELERALAEQERCAQPLERGRTLLALGTAQRRAKHRAAARASLGQALELFDHLGAPLWAEKAASEIARIPGRVAGTDRLSETERRVAELAAEGYSNKEIASRLFVSVRAVEANLSRVYAKLGVRSRAQLASRLAREQG
jgi:DNA-binding CsgD family transcriptional regulator